MGIFDFVKDAGAKIFGGDTKEAAAAEPEVNHAREAYLKAQAEETAERAQAKALEMMLTNMGFDLSTFEISIDNGRATLVGGVQSQEELEKIVLIVGNTSGVHQVDAQLQIMNPPPEPEPEATFYTVVKGDNLSKIAKAHYGEASKYRLIFEANKPMLKDPDKIYPGQVLRIPALKPAAVA
jgi:nucleoid-associated protein YgaU